MKSAFKVRYDPVAQLVNPLPAMSSRRHANFRCKPPKPPAMPCRWFFGFCGLIRRIVNRCDSQAARCPAMIQCHRKRVGTRLKQPVGCKPYRHEPVQIFAKVLTMALPSAGCISGLTCYLTEIATDLLLFGAVVAKSRSIVESINNGA